MLSGFGTGIGEHKTKIYTLSTAAKNDNVSLWLSGGYRKSSGFALADGFSRARNEDGGLRDNSGYEKRDFSPLR